MTTATANSNKTWAPDLSHSEVTFKVKHMMISTVSGRFEKFDAALDGFDGSNLEGANIRFSAEIASINTSNDQRDAHLKSADFFDAENHPVISFLSEEIKSAGGSSYLVTGPLSIRGNSRPVQFQVEFGGVLNDPWGNAKAGFTLNGKINRTDFGLNWNAALEAGGWLVAEEVQFAAEVQFAGQA